VQFILLEVMMNTQNLDISNPKEHKNILALLPAKNTPETLKTKMLRVDHAGEFGAVHIYRGQVTALQSASDKNDVLAKIQEMGEHEKVHLNTFNQILTERRIRPSLLSPLWHFGGFFMGAVTALISDTSAMACTEAVETVIDKHYAMQIDYYEQETQQDSILDTLKQFRQDELNHKQEAIDSHSENAPFYTATKCVIQAICHSVIKLAHKV
jgi:3-demethoxyubiquinol 3-hydroxylase